MVNKFISIRSTLKILIQYDVFRHKRRKNKSFPALKFEHLLKFLRVHFISRRLIWSKNGYDIQPSLKVIYIGSFFNKKVQSIS